MHAHAPSARACSACRNGAAELDFDFTMAFQPIVDLRHGGSVFAYEALVRGADGSSAASVLARVNDGNRYAFDQACRVRAVELAARLGIDCRLSINFLPNAVYQPESCIQVTLQAARRNGFPVERIIFEVAEHENAHDREHLNRILRAYRRQGLRTAIDDFGAGYAGLGLLADFQPDMLKIDMALVRGIGADPVRQAIVRGVVSMGESLGIAVIAEGVETEDELRPLRAMGVHLYQGYLFARPALEALPAVQWPQGAGFGNGFGDAAEAPPGGADGTGAPPAAQRAMTGARSRGGAGMALGFGLG
ncbi:EAL domain-containing protein [Paracidovorax avenae]|uniref:EAL domain-containing protein n=1 Tax=Paracidovorax avenae TaxID=80867 RepID=UPI000D1FEDC1|nr:EAL domain-containing protein [Paracidovorax avenae]AVS85180.1 EAL domain-containing protein [Paracidovorax avenae]AVS95449.1 EAL domain-containing protein [Paracidovorax avenae]AVT02119.1 EAL domain-containing protein [Paracidovorax avenae]AVT12351.1 EAL domain-containing protein [Paracidovorax avenae]